MRPRPDLPDLAQSERVQRLLDAIERGDVAAVAACLAVRPAMDINAQDNTGMSALARATMTGCGPLIQELLNSGAFTEVRDQYGNTPLGHAMRLGHVEAFEVLARAGSDLMGQDNKGIAYWKTAVHEIHEDLLLAWLQQGGPADVVDPMGWSLLMLASEAGMERLVHALLAAGANPFRMTQGGDTVLDVATNETRRVLEAWKQAREWQQRLGQVADQAGCINDDTDGEREKRRI